MSLTSVVGDVLGVWIPGVQSAVNLIGTKQGREALGKGWLKWNADVDALRDLAGRIGVRYAQDDAWRASLTDADKAEIRKFGEQTAALVKQRDDLRSMLKRGAAYAVKLRLISQEDAQSAGLAGSLGLGPLVIVVAALAGLVAVGGAAAFLAGYDKGRSATPVAQATAQGITQLLARGDASGAASLIQAGKTPGLLSGVGTLALLGLGAWFFLRRKGGNA